MEATGTLPALSPELAESKMPARAMVGLRAVIASTLAWKHLYWLIWLAILAVELTTHEQLDYQWWLLSSQGWWFAPFALMFTIPRERPQGAWVLLTLWVFSQLLVSFWTFVVDSTFDWFSPLELGTLMFLPLALQLLLCTALIAALFARPTIWTFGKQARVAALAMGLAAAIQVQGPWLSESERWLTKPLGQQYELFGFILMALSIAVGVERLRLTGTEDELIARRGQWALPVWTRRWIGIRSGTALYLFALILFANRPGRLDALGEHEFTLGLGTVWVAGLLGLCAIANRDWTAPVAEPRRGWLGRWRKPITRTDIVVIMAPLWFLTLWLAAPRIGDAFIVWADRSADSSLELREREGGRVLVLDGAINAGDSQAIRRKLKAMPGIQIVELKSPGGLSDEGRAIAALIRARRLTTVVSEHCESACTYLFLAGQDRWLVGEGQLGFHRSSFLGLPGSTNAEEEIAYFHELGFDNELIDRVASISHRDMWYPQSDELLGHGMVTALLRPAEYRSLFEGQVDLSKPAVDAQRR